jgi:hypothetical protein
MVGDTGRREAWWLGGGLMQRKMKIFFYRWTMLNMLEIRIFREHNVAGLTTPTTVFAFFPDEEQGVS